MGLEFMGNEVILKYRYLLVFELLFYLHYLVFGYFFKKMFICKYI